ncbi:MAG: alpha/beta hydrolase [Gemmatimonadota bacterium]|nr:alpha/beta hydrolase [Gemmatimonadota bacterium]
MPRSHRPLTPALVLALAPLVACGGSDAVPRYVSVPPTPYTFVSSAGDTVQAERGELLVPENRANPDSRSIRLAYVRFPSTSPNPASPIVYLAGGPGGSGIATARGRRFPLFMALREIGDVIAFDQRGTGDSNQIPRCETDHTVSLDTAPTVEIAIAAYRAAATECLAFWEGEGVDIRGYTTVESARDLGALRDALDADRISLWGISYGTHLAMAAARELGSRRIDRIILASAEGLDQTVKQPARTDAYFGRLQEALNTDPVLGEAIPDAAGLIRRLTDRLAAEPATITVPGEDGADPIEFIMGPAEIQLLLAFNIADPPGAARTLMLLADADARGSFDQIGQIVWQGLRQGTISMGGMSEAMDAASGISDEALARFEEQSRTALLDGVLNFPMPWLRDAFGDLDLGPEFRENPQVDRPTLLLSGTLDGRTYPESQLEATSGFTDLTHVVIENAGHNLFMVMPEVTETILTFMRGQEVANTRLVYELPPYGR